MKVLLRTLAAALLALGLNSATAAEPVLFYERVHSQVGGTDNRVSLTLYDDGSAEAHFPAYTPQAGDYRWQLNPEERNHLLGLAERVPEVDANRILHELGHGRSGAHTVVTDADRVTVRLVDGTRGEHAVSLPSPEIWLRSRPDDEQLAAFVETVSALSDWMRNRAEEGSR